MYYLKLFQNHSEYEEAKTSGLTLPNVSHCINEAEVHYNPIPHDYSKEYLTTIALEDGTIGFNINEYHGTGLIKSISYSKDGGQTWITTQNQDDKESSLIITVNVNEGDSILWKGDAQALADNVGGGYDSSSFISSAKFNAEGNIMSLLYGDNFINKDEVEWSYGGEFAGLFGNDSILVESSKIVDAKNLFLPHKVLHISCYEGMFYDCTLLVNAPELLATTLASSCYEQMFRGCTSLTTAPELLATTLANYCYSGMFRGCTSLTTAPELLATTLANYCYSSMFQGCTSLNYIKAMFTTTPSTTYTQNWVSGVAASGTFVKNSAAQWNVSGVNGIPNGWTVETASA